MGDHPLLEHRSHLVEGRDQLFAGLSIGPVTETVWRRDADHAICGMFWTATDADGIHWAADETHRIACLPSRAFRFFSHGVLKRCASITYRYLRGLIPIRRGGVAINFGANIGEVAIVLEGMGAKVFAIEPDPNLLPYLWANAAGLRIVVVPVAAWSRNKTVGLYLRSDTADSSIFNTADKCVFVPGVPIDMLTMGSDEVDLICGDAEGAEPEVLQGSRETLKRTRYVSVSGSAERCGERTIEACEAILVGAGFDIIHRDADGFCMLLGKNKAL